MLAFTAHCGRGHDDVTFTERDSFEQHCKAVHRTRRLATPNRGTPRPWKAPRVPKDWDVALAAVLAASPDAELLVAA